MVDESKKPQQVISDFDLAWMIGIKLVESGLITPELREKLCEEGGIELVISSVIATMKRNLKVEEAPLIPPDFLLREDEYVVHVNYKIPGYKRLHKEFPGGVSAYFEEKQCWAKYPSCRRIHNTPRLCVMRIKSYEKTAIDVATADMEDEGYRPATHWEAYAFARTHPDAIKYLIVAHGSSDNEYICYVGRDLSKRAMIFGHQWIRDAFNHFLCVRHENQPMR